VTTALDAETDVEVGELVLADNQDGLVHLVSEESADWVSYCLCLRV
jgi:hypothetical protein